MQILKYAKANKNIPVIFSILTGFVFACIILFMVGTNPFTLLNKMFENSFRNQRTFLLFMQQFALFAPLGLSALFSLKVGFFNIGAPGQMVFAGMCASLFALHTSMPTVLHAIATTIVAILAATFMSLLSAALKYFFKINEIVSTVLLNWCALELLKLVFYSTKAFKDNPSRIDGATPSVPESSDWISQGLLNNGTFTITIIVAILCLISAGILIRYTKFGYKLSMIGGNERAAYISGYKIRLISMISIAISGVLVGLFAMGQYFGKNTEMTEIMSGYPPTIGFNGLIICIMGGKSVLGIMFSALLLNFLQGFSSENLIGIPSSMPQIFASCIIYFVAIARLYENWFDVRNYVNRKINFVKEIKWNEIWRKVIFWDRRKIGGK